MTVKATTALQGTVLKGAALTAPASTALTDSTAGTRDDTVADVSGAIGTGIDSITLSTLNSRLVTINNNFSEIVEEYNLLRARVEDIVTKLQTSGVLT